MHSQGTLTGCALRGCVVPGLEGLSTEVHTTPAGAALCRLEVVGSGLMSRAPWAAPVGADGGE